MFRADSKERVPDPRLRGMNPKFVKMVWEKRRRAEREKRASAKAEAAKAMNQHAKYMEDNPAELAMADVAEVARIHGVLLAEILGPSQIRYVVRARQAACFMVWYSTGASFHAIGRLIGCDHTTAQWSIGQHMYRLGWKHELVGFVTRRKTINNARRKAHYRALKRAEMELAARFSQAA